MSAHLTNEEMERREYMDRREHTYFGSSADASQARARWLREAHAALRAEREETTRWRRESATNAMRYQARVDELEEENERLRARVVELESAEAELDAAREALRKYGRHSRDCALLPELCVGDPEPHCTCGLRAALGEQP